jgi:exopolysaccharide biosynthesis polyprenyl glycosylphosphotransferase
MATPPTTQPTRPLAPLDDLPTAAVERDVRRKKPPVLSFLLRADTFRRLARFVTLLTLDFAGIFAAILTALALKAAARDVLDFSVVFQQTQDYVSFGFLVMALLFARSGLYGDRPVRPGLTSIVSSLFQTTLVVLIYAVVSGKEFSSFYIFYGSLLFAVAYIATLRFFYERTTGILLRAAGYRRRALLVGTGEHIVDVARALLAGSGPAPTVVGFISLTPRPDNGLVSLGAIEELPAVLVDHSVDEVIIADPDFPEQQAVELVDQCHQRGVVVRIAPSTMELLVHRAEFVPGQSVPLFELKPPVFEGFDYVLKRAFDLVGASFLLLVLSPVLAVAALAVRFSSRGPIVYRSMRPGIGGVPFACFKFRTMYADADARQGTLESSNEKAGAIFKMRNDPRVTPIGRFLRRWSIDELPQLFNVLRGEMSLVGPRPVIPYEVEQYPKWYRARFAVRPGMTGLWQVSGRNERTYEEMVRLDIEYAERQSLGLDLKILLKTIRVVLSGRGVA